MGDFFEKIIRENEDVLTEDAPDGHFERFEAKLDKTFKHQHKNKTKIYWQIAAAVVFALLLGNQLRIYLVPSQVEPKQLSLASVAPEYGEVEFYFTSTIDQNIREWEKLVHAGFISEADQQMMKKEMQEFDNVQSQLLKELAANPGDQRVVNAMLEYYQTKLSVITLIIDKLKEVKQKKSTNNETEI